MTKDEEQKFKKLVKEGTLEALKSENGQEAIKTGTIEAMKSDEGKDVILDVFVEAFHMEKIVGASI